MWTIVKRFAVTVLHSQLARGTETAHTELQLSFGLSLVAPRQDEQQQKIHPGSPRNPQYGASPGLFSFVFFVRRRDEC